MDLKLLAGLVGAYILGLPILLRLFFFAQRKMVTSMKVKMARGNTQKLKTMAMPESKWPGVSERLRFTFKDTRSVQMKEKTFGLQNRQLFFILLGAGLLLFILPAFGLPWGLLGLGAFVFIIAIAFGNTAPKKVLATRKKVMERMYNIARSKLSITLEDGAPISSIITVHNWENMVKPTKVEFKIPDTFGEEGGEGFLKQFNQIFGTESAWVPSDDPETGKPGWDFEAGKVTIHAVPPLPQIAKWHERYVLDEGVAWSFFPIALGVENGIEIPNPETGEIENVLGFDLSGEAVKAAKKKGYKVSPAITTSPMALVGGGTGGGKAFSIATPVAVFGTVEAPKPVNPSPQTLTHLNGGEGDLSLA